MDQDTEIAVAAGEAAELAVAEVVGAEAAPPEPSPDAQLAAAVTLGVEEQATAREEIRANAEVEIARLTTERPEWMTEIFALLSRIEAVVTSLSTPAQSVTVVTPPDQAVTEPDQAVTEPTPTPAVAADPMQVSSEDREDRANPARRKRRWI